jgi:ribosomal protein S18 acetylase RimI-like enzyme
VNQRQVVLSVKADSHRAIVLYHRYGFKDAGQSPDEADERFRATSRRNP